MKIFSCNGNVPLAKKIAQNLNLKLVDSEIKRFKDGEISIQIKEKIRGEKIFIIQPTSVPVNDNLMELLLSIDALKRASAEKITVVLPYYGYSRQDRRSEIRSPISAKLVADLITSVGADNIITLDLHAQQIQGFFNIPVDELHADLVFSENIKETFKKEIAIISPDAGGISRARFFAKKLGTKLAIIDKRRPEAGVCEIMHIIGDVEGKDCIIVDDMVDSGGTLCKAAKSLIDNGANSVSAYITHGVFSSNAVEKIENSVLQKLVITDSISQTQDVFDSKKIKIISVAPLFSECIDRMQKNESIFSLSGQ
jgi:ribose-phosphate pyrophosphokinase